MGHQQAIELLPYQIRSLAAENYMRSPQVSFEFVQRGFDFPSVVIKCRQFCRRRQFVVEDARYILRGERIMAFRKKEQATA